VRRPVSIFLAIAVLLCAGGCGSGGEAGSTAPQAQTKKQFLQQAHSICYRLSKKQVRQMEAFGKRHGFDTGSPSPHEFEQVNAAVVMPIVEEKIEELGALPVPDGDEAQVEQIIQSMERGIRVTEAHPAWLAAPTAAHPDPFEATLELTAAYGIWLCGQP
jgi:hypothetical protein